MQIFLFQISYLYKMSCFVVTYNPKNYRACKEHPVLININVFRVYPCMQYSELPFDLRLLHFEKPQRRIGRFTINDNE